MPGTGHTATLVPEGDPPTPSLARGIEPAFRRVHSVTPERLLSPIRHSAEMGRNR